MPMVAQERAPVRASFPGEAYQISSLSQSEVASFLISGSTPELFEILKLRLEGVGGWVSGG